ncbi:hypothetical protein NST50_05310 [Paenibacillus sp. FSL E2-0202]|uniref:hypothetical protein n=1 Tax=Paenibacillus sp. FSL E2-0202 TaxID=2954505 RepID=UPI0030ECC11F
MPYPFRDELDVLNAIYVELVQAKGQISRKPSSASIRYSRRVRSRAISVKTTAKPKGSVKNVTTKK